MIKAVLVTKDDVKVVEFEPELEEYYRLLECELIAITPRKVGGVYYDVVCDEEGALKPVNHISGVDAKRHVFMLVGNLLLCNHNDEGEETSLTDDDIHNIMHHIVAVSADAEGEDVSLAIDMQY